MFKPEISIYVFHYNTKELELITKNEVQYFTPDQTYDLWEHKPNKRGDHLYFKIGESNCRENFMNVHFGDDGFLNSMANVITLNNERKLTKNDQIVCSFTGFEENDNTGITVVYDCGKYLTEHERLTLKYSFNIVDDMELLIEKYNAL